MKGFWIFIPILLGLTLFLNNYDRLLVNQIGPVVGFGLDKVNDKYHVTIQLANASGNIVNPKSQLSQITTYDGFDATASTISDAYRKISYQIPKKLDTSHLQIIILSEKLLKSEGIEPTLDFLLRLSKSSINVPIAIVKNNNVTDLMKVYTPLNDFPALDIRHLLLNIADRNSTRVFTSPSNLATNLNKKGIDIYLPELQVTGDIEKGRLIENIQTSSPHANVSLSGYSIFHHSKPIDSISIEEGITYFLALGKVKEGILEANCSNNKRAVLTINDIKSDKKIIKCKKPIIELSINIDGTLKENDCKNISQAEVKGDKKELEKKFEKNMKKNLDNLIKKSINSNSDILGLGNAYYIKNPNKWKKIESNFLKNVIVKTSVRVSINNIGNVNYHPKVVKHEV